MIVAQPRELIWAWLNARANVPWSDDLRVIGLVRNDCLCAAVGYNGFNDGMCFMHSAVDSPSSITKESLRAIFEYPFKQLNLKYILATVHSGNHMAMRVNAKAGFKEVHRLKDASARGGDIVILQLVPEDCRYLKD